jgi:2-hydroxychromene-2-carboxylate isomerase
MLDFYFDYASPWSYLASALIPKHFPDVKIVYRPIYLRGLEMFSKGLPYSAQKLRYIGADLLRCAEFEKIPIRIPTNFPVNGLYAVRGALAALEANTFDAYHARMFRAVWVEDRDIGNKSVVQELAPEFAIESPAIKDKLKRDTAEAESRGVFGVPTFFVGDEMFWGHDRMDYVVRALEKGRQRT